MVNSSSTRGLTGCWHLQAAAPLPACRAGLLPVGLRARAPSESESPVSVQVGLASEAAAQLPNQAPALRAVKFVLCWAH